MGLFKKADEKHPIYQGGSFISTGNRNNRGVNSNVQKSTSSDAPDVPDSDDDQDTQADDSGSDSGSSGD